MISSWKTKKHERWKGIALNATHSSTVQCREYVTADTPARGVRFEIVGGTLQELASSRGAHGFEGAGEVGSEGLLDFFGELLFLAGEVEDVDGGFAFGVN